MKIIIKKKCFQQNNKKQRATQSQDRKFKIKANIFQGKNKDPFACNGSLWKSQNNEDVTKLLVNKNKKIFQIYFSKHEGNGSLVYKT